LDLPYSFGNENIFKNFTVENLKNRQVPKPIPNTLKQRIQRQNIIAFKTQVEHKLPMFSTCTVSNLTLNIFNTYNLIA